MQKDKCIKRDHSCFQRGAMFLADEAVTIKEEYSAHAAYEKVKGIYQTKKMPHARRTRSRDGIKGGATQNVCSTHMKG